MIHEALRQGGFGLWPEQCYPTDEAGRRRRSEGKRCDLVLTAPPGKLPLRDVRARGTLFGTGPGVDLDQAYWLEIKTVAQFEGGEPFARYSSELFSPVSQDVKKLWLDPVIRYAGLLLVLFTADEAVAAHDLAAWHARCLDRHYPVAPPAARGFAITNRVGNGWCAAAVFGVRGA